MSKNKKILALLISKIINESEFKLKREIVKTTLRLTCLEDTHVPDLMTRVRILPSVAVVGQKERVVRPTGGNVTLTLYVKYLPTVSETLYESLVSLSKKIKSLPGVEVVSVVTVDGRSVLFKGEKIVI
tara:strand:+ start:91 stop:474 length:384 start_codon:yes stop_codon:yes gene_type:complete